MNTVFELLGDEYPSGAPTGTKIYQLFIVPSQPDEKGAAFVAFCPFSRLSAVGPNPEQACMAWCQQANIEFTEAYTSYMFPTMLRRRKVWYGITKEATSGQNVNTWIVDYKNDCQLHVYIQERSNNVEIAYNGPEPGFVIDWPIHYTPVIAYKTPSSRVQTLSTTTLTV